MGSPALGVCEGRSPLSSSACGIWDAGPPDSEAGPHKRRLLWGRDFPCAQEFIGRDGCDAGPPSQGSAPGPSGPPSPHQRWTGTRERARYQSEAAPPALLSLQGPSSLSHTHSPSASGSPLAAGGWVGASNSILSRNAVQVSGWSPARPPLTAQRTIPQPLLPVSAASSCPSHPSPRLPAGGEAGRSARKGRS